MSDRIIRIVVPPGIQGELVERAISNVCSEYGIGYSVDIEYNPAEMAIKDKQARLRKYFAVKRFWNNVQLRKGFKVSVR